MTKPDDNQQDLLHQFYDLQQQYLNNLKQFYEPPKPADPMQQFWQQWMNPGASMQQPFAAIPNPAFDWFKGGAGSMESLYQGLNQQLMAQLMQPFSAVQTAAPWTQTGVDLNTFFAPFQEHFAPLFTGLLDDEERAQAEALLQSMAEYQQVMLEINQLMAKLAQDSLAELQKLVSSSPESDLSKVPLWWTEITQKMLNDAGNSPTYRKLQDKFSQVKQQIDADSKQYRAAVAKGLGLVTQDSYQALLDQVEKLQAQVASMSSGSGESAAQDPYDFTSLNGIGKKFNDKLHEQGIRNLEQLASMSDDMLKNLDSDLQAKGRVFQDHWREQAEQFLNTMTGKTGRK